jgi:hypothetical protein
MDSVPLNGRSFTDLLATQPGVIPASSAQPNAVVMSGCTNTPPSGDLDAGNLSVSGQRETANGFSVNGGTVEEDFNNGTAIVPNLDSIENLRVLTNNFDGEYGNFSGGEVQVTTKSGGDAIHGSAFEFLRTTDLDARNYFAAERAAFDRNQYGGSLGGPIRKDKVFFFLDYQGTRMTQGQETGNIYLPSAADRSGNLLDLASQFNGKVSSTDWAAQLSDKLGYDVWAGERYYIAVSDSTPAVPPAVNAFCPMHSCHRRCGQPRQKICCSTFLSQLSASTSSQIPQRTKRLATTRRLLAWTCIHASAISRPTISSTSTA